MSSRLKIGPISSIDDMLGDLLGDEGYQVSSGSSLSKHKGKRSLLDDDFFSKLAEEVANDDVDSDVSEADPMALLENMKDMDDMDADLFKAKKKPTSAPAQTSGGAQADPAKSNTTSSRPEEALGVKPASAPASTARGSASTAQGYKTFSFTDLDDPLADLLDNLPLESPEKQSRTRGSDPDGAQLSAPKAATRKETAAAKQLSRKQDELMFEDDEDDLMFALGFGESPKQSPVKKEVVLLPRKESSDPQQRARTRLDEILGRGTSPRLLERPPTGEKKQQQDKQGKTPKDPLLEEDLMFGSYQPTLASTPEGRQSRRQSVRFSTEDVSASTPEKKCETSATPSTSPPLSHSAADWLGLKVEDSAGGGAEEPALPPASSERNALFTSATEPAIMVSGPTPIPPTTSATSSKQPQAEASLRKEEDDWLVEALNKKRKKIQMTRPNEQEEVLGLGENLNPPPTQSCPLTPTQSCPLTPTQSCPPSPMASDRELPSRTETNQSATTSPQPQQPQPQHSQPHHPQPQPHHSQPQPHHPQSQPHHPQPSQPHHPQPHHPQPSQPHHPQPHHPQSSQPQPHHPQPQPHHLQPQPQPPQPHPHHPQPQQPQRQPQHQHPQPPQPQPQPHNQPQLPPKPQQPPPLQDFQDPGWPSQTQLPPSYLGQPWQLAMMPVFPLHSQYQHAPAVLTQQQFQLLEPGGAVDMSGLQQQAKKKEEEEQDLWARILQLEGQVRALQVNQTEGQEREHTEMMENPYRVDGVGVMESSLDRKEQVQTVKRLKDEEVDAVTSASSQTRCLAAVMEQMKIFSCRLGELVESSKERTTQSLLQGAQHRDDQLHMLQERLEQQRAVEEERVCLQVLVSKMDTQLAEQHRQLEKDRWKVTAEQAKAEAAQRGLEEERRSLTQHLAMEREELERAKTTLLEQQQEVMQQCAEERRRLKTEWSRFHGQEKEQQARAEREASRALEREAHREAAIIKMAQEQAELKLRAGELKQREESVTREREGLERERAELERRRAELEREKERLSGLALTLKTRAEEVEAFSKLASEKHEEGERALQEARRVEQEHQTRLRSIHAHLDTLRQQEQHLHQERVRMTDHRRQMEIRRQNLPQVITTDFSPMLLMPQKSHTLEPAAGSSSPEATELQARLALLRHTAQKDHDFLHDEQYFLNTLKNSPHQAAFHTD